MSGTPTMRPWNEIEFVISQTIGPTMDRRRCIRIFLEAAWPKLKETGVSWMGFYEADLPQPATTSLLLTDREPKPACSPIGLHGACGNSFKSGRTIVVRDVAELGADYIACDPRDRSELVVPCFDRSGRPWGVVDLDSFEVGSFSTSDAKNIDRLLKLARLTGETQDSA